MSPGEAWREGYGVNLCAHIRLLLESSCSRRCVGRDISTPEAISEMPASR
jgi:hypothetical protein